MPELHALSSSIPAPLARGIAAFFRPFFDATPLTPAHLQRVRQVYRVVLPAYALVALISARNLLVRDPILALSWSYTCVVLIVASVLLLVRPAQALRTMQVTYAMLVLGFLSRVVHAVASAGPADINLQSLTGPLVVGAIVTHTIFAHKAARRFNQLLASAATTLAAVGLLSRTMIEPDHVLAVVRFALCAFGAMLLTEFMTALQHEYSQLRAEHALMERLALNDALTALPNRRASDALLEREVARTRRNRGELSVLLIDVDGFKSINDRFGHAAGDAALTGVARVLREQLRASDAAARWAGDEFVVVLPDTDLTGALVLGERLRAAVVRDARLGVGGVTISVGASSFELAGDDATRLVQRADRGLYRAKELLGRNRVAAAPVRSGLVSIARTA